MTLIDSRGRLFGRVHVIDALVLLLASVAIPAAAVSYRSLRGSALEIQTVSPATVPAGGSTRVQLAGTGLRPYLQAYVVAAGTPIVLTQTDRMSRKATYLLSSAIAADLELPALESGRYDLYLYDQGRQVISKPNAITVVSPEPQAARQAKVRFYLAPETASLIRVGDRDEHGAVITEVRQSSERSEIMEMHLLDRENLWTGQRVTGNLVEVALDMPLVESAPGRWTYGSGPPLAGDVLLLTTDRYRLHGVITWIGDLQRKPQPQ